jgi:hypothetical protein
MKPKRIRLRATTAVSSRPFELTRAAGLQPAECGAMWLREPLVNRNSEIEIFSDAKAN